jgi:hypothetical protein
LRNLGLWLDSSEEDVESDGSSVQRRLLRHESNVLAIILDVEFGDLLVIELS